MLDEEAPGDLLRRGARTRSSSPAGAPPDAAASDQVLVLVRKRGLPARAAVRTGTRSASAAPAARASCSTSQRRRRRRSCPTPFADILRADHASVLAHRCGPRSGRASPPTRSTARAPFVRAEARARTPGDTPIVAPCGWRRPTCVLQMMRSNVAAAAARVRAHARARRPEALRELRLRHPHQQPEARRLAAGRRHRQPRHADLRHRRLPQRLQVQPRRATCATPTARR